MRRRISSNIAHEKMYAQDIFGILQNQQQKITQLLDKAKQEQHSSEILSDEQQQQVGVSQQLLRELSSYECSAERINSLLQKRMTSLQKLRQQRILSEDAYQRQSMQQRQNQYPYQRSHHPQWYETQLSQQEFNQSAARTRNAQSAVGKRSSCDISDLSSILEQHRMNQMLPQESASNMFQILPRKQNNKASPYLPSSISKKQQAQQSAAKKNMSNLKQRRNNFTGNARQYYYNIDIVETNLENDSNKKNKNNSDMPHRQNNSNLIHIVANENVELSQVTQIDENHQTTQAETNNDISSNKQSDLEQLKLSENNRKSDQNRNDSVIEEEEEQIKNTKNSQGKQNQPQVSKTERSSIKSNQQIETNTAQQYRQTLSSSVANLNQLNKNAEIMISVTARVESRINEQDKEYKSNEREDQTQIISNQLTNNNINSTNVVPLEMNDQTQTRDNTKQDSKNVKSNNSQAKKIAKEVVQLHDLKIENSYGSIKNEEQSESGDGNSNNRGDLKNVESIKQVSSLQISKDQDPVMPDQQTLRQRKRVRAYSALDCLNSEDTPIKKASSITSIKQHYENEAKSKKIKQNLNNLNQTDQQGCFETDQEPYKKNGSLKRKDCQQQNKQEDYKDKVFQKNAADENSIQNLQIEIIKKNCSSNNNSSPQSISQQEEEDITKNSILNITFQDPSSACNSINQTKHNYINNSTCQQKSNHSILINEDANSSKENVQDVNTITNIGVQSVENKINSGHQQTYPSNTNATYNISNRHAAVAGGSGHTFIDKQEVNIILPVDMPVFQIDQFLRFFPKLDTQINLIKQPSSNNTIAANATNQSNRGNSITASDSTAKLLLKTEQDCMSSNVLVDHDLDNQDNQTQHQQTSSCQSLLILKEQTLSKANIQQVNYLPISRHNYCLNSTHGINSLKDNNDHRINNDTNKIINKYPKDSNCSLRNSLSITESNVISNKTQQLLMPKNYSQQTPALSFDNTNNQSKPESETNRTQQVTASFNAQLPSSNTQTKESVSFASSANQRVHSINNVNTRTCNEPSESYHTPLKYSHPKQSPQQEQSNTFQPMYHLIHHQTSLNNRHPDYSSFIPQPSDTCTVFSRRSNSFDQNSDNMNPNDKSSSNPKIYSRFRQFVQKDDQHVHGCNNNKIRNASHQTYINSNKRKNQRYDQNVYQQLNTSANTKSKKDTFANKGALNQSYHNRRNKNTQIDLIYPNNINRNLYEKDLSSDEQTYQQSPGSFQFELTSRTGEASIGKQTNNNQHGELIKDLDQNDNSNTTSLEDTTRNGRNSKFVREDSGTNYQIAGDQEQQQLVDPKLLINRLSMPLEQSISSSGIDNPSQNLKNSNQLISFQLSPSKNQVEQTVFYKIEQHQFKQSTQKEHSFEFTSPAFSNAFDLNNPLNQKQRSLSIRNQPQPRINASFKEDHIFDQINPSLSQNQKQTASNNQGIYSHDYSQKQNSQNSSVDNNLEERSQIKDNLIQIQKQSTQLKQALPTISKIFETSNQNIQKDKCYLASRPNPKTQQVNYSSCDSNQVQNQEQKLSSKPPSNNNNSNYNSQYCWESIPPPQIGSEKPDDPTTNNIPNFSTRQSFNLQERNGNNSQEASHNKNTTNISAVSQNQDISSLSDQLQLQFFKSIDPTNSTFFGSACQQYKEQLKTPNSNGLVIIDPKIFSHYEKIGVAQTNGVNDIIKHSDQAGLSSSIEDQTRERKYFSVLEQRMTYQIEANLLFLEKSLQCSKSSTKEELLEKLKEFRIEMVSSCEQQDKSVANLKVRHHHLLDSFELPSKHIIGNFSF